ncbi:MAG: hypothetical protein WC736_15565 [Gallionella sp.]|jgi:hypothetical protein
MKAGTVVRLSDGRYGTVVYNGLDGVGIKWGRHQVTLDDLLGSGGMLDEKVPNDYPWKADAMLRNPYPGAEMPCVGEDYEIAGEDAA